MAKVQLNNDMWAEIPDRPKRPRRRVFAIPITVVEYGRQALIEADSKKEALRRFHTSGWDELTDATRFKVTKVGAITEDK